MENPESESGLVSRIPESQEAPESQRLDGRRDPPINSNFVYPTLTATMAWSLLSVFVFIFCITQAVIAAPRCRHRGKWMPFSYKELIINNKTRLKILPVLTREHYTSLLHWV
jgi:hypothetical protein